MGLPSIQYHRGFTHGIGGILTMPMLLAGLLWLLDRWQSANGDRAVDARWWRQWHRRPVGRDPVRFGWLVALAYLGTLTHPLLDFTNTYGIQLLAPFSERWFHGDTLFIIDVWIWSALALAIWLSRRWERAGRPGWRRPAITGMAVVAAYICANAVLSYKAEQATRKLAQGFYGIDPDFLMAGEEPVKFWRRQTIWRRVTTLGRTDYDLVSGRLTNIGRPLETGMMDPAVSAAARQDRQLAAFLNWSLAPIARVEQTTAGTVVHVGDARFCRSAHGEQLLAAGDVGPAMSNDPVILWLRRDLRLSDQSALKAAMEAGPVIPVYVLDDARAGDHKMGGASRWWLHHSLASLDKDLRDKGSRLVLRQGDCVAVLSAIAAQHGAREIHAMRHYEPWWVEAEKTCLPRSWMTKRGCASTMETTSRRPVASPPVRAIRTKSIRRSGKPCASRCRRKNRCARRLRSMRRTPGQTATIWPTGSCCRPIRTGPQLLPICGHRARKRHAPASTPSDRTRPAMTRRAICPLKMVAPASARICISARYRPAMSGTALPTPRAMAPCS